MINDHCFGIFSTPPPRHTHTHTHNLLYVLARVSIFSSQQLCFRNWNLVNCLIRGSLPSLNTLCKRTCNFWNGGLSVSQIFVWLPSHFAERYEYIQNGSVSWCYVPGEARVPQVVHYQNSRLRPSNFPPPLSPFKHANPTVSVLVNVYALKYFYDKNIMKREIQ